MGKKKNEQRIQWENDPRLFPVDQIGRDSTISDKDYKYLLRSENDDVVEARARLEKWFAEFNTDSKEKWRLYRSFSGRDERNYLSAFWELYCHHLLVKQNFDVIVHPDLDTEKENHLDFLVQRQGKPVFFLECSILDGPEIEEASQRRMYHLIDDLLQRVKSHHFEVHISFKIRGEKSPSAKTIADRIKNFLNNTEAKENISFDIEVDDWLLSVSAHPKRGTRVTSDLTVRSHSWGGGHTSVNMTQSIMRKLNEKRAHRYGVTNLPYIIAVNCRSGIDNENVEYALYGDIFDEKRMSDGFFCGQNSHASGMLWVCYLMPTSTNREPVLWHNPNAINPIPGELWSGPQARYNASKDVVEFS
ncbi:MAG: hypothetical protein GY854_01555 [Deltaproteobacteria bacterium]|nr:hypothetical protein [Deltaproteobacteria bacterium]